MIETIISLRTTTASLRRPPTWQGGGAGWGGGEGEGACWPEARHTMRHSSVPQAPAFMVGMWG